MNPPVYRRRHERTMNSYVIVLSITGSQEPRRAWWGFEVGIGFHPAPHGGCAATKLLWSAGGFGLQQRTVRAFSGKRSATSFRLACFGRIAFGRRLPACPTEIVATCEDTRV